MPTREPIPLEAFAVWIAAVLLGTLAMHFAHLVSGAGGDASIGRRTRLLFRAVAWTAWGLNGTGGLLLLVELALGRPLLSVNPLVVMGMFGTIAIPAGAMYRALDISASR